MQQIDQEMTPTGHCGGERWDEVKDDMTVETSRKSFSMPPAFFGLTWWSSWSRYQ